MLRWPALPHVVASALLLAVFATQLTSTPVSASVDITYSPTTNTVTVEGPGSIVTLTSIQDAIRNERVLRPLGDGEWYLEANLFIDIGVQLHLYGHDFGGDVEWLKLRSDPAGFIWLKTFDGEISMKGTKVTSWDEGSGTFDTAFDDGSGRSFLLAKNGRPDVPLTRMDVWQSELAYLGYSAAEAYGVSWRVYKGGEGGPEGVTGTIQGSKFHHNFYGAYTYSAAGMVWRENEFYENIGYGLDPHDDSRDFLVEDNAFYANGSHGLIFSVRCVGNVIRNNRAYDNGRNGIMLDADSNGNLVEGNEVYGNRSGIVIQASDGNFIVRNDIHDNDIGIRIDSSDTVQHSRANVIRSNVIRASDSYAVYSYPLASSNQWEDNQVYDNGVDSLYVAPPENDGEPRPWMVYARIGLPAALLVVGLLTVIFNYTRKRRLGQTPAAFK